MENCKRRISTTITNVTILHSPHTSLSPNFLAMISSYIFFSLKNNKNYFNNRWFQGKSKQFSCLRIIYIFIIKQGYLNLLFLQLWHTYSVILNENAGIHLTCTHIAQILHFLATMASQKCSQSSGFKHFHLHYRTSMLQIINLDYLTRSTYKNM